MHGTAVEWSLIALGFGAGNMFKWMWGNGDRGMAIAFLVIVALFLAMF